MMKQLIEGSHAVAEMVRLCGPKVIAAFPITPQTHIVEKLAEIVAQKKLDAQFINVESEFSAISVILGAQAAGVRTFTATASQGLALMHEVLHATSGLRMPLVMVVANRALSAPINIWGDQSDSVAQRDTGWIQLYAESIQEAADLIPQAYKIAEKAQLPVMVCMDGYYLTHTKEVADIPTSLKGFLGNYKPKIVLDPKKPITIGPLANPDYFQEIKKEQDKALRDSDKIVSKVAKEYSTKFKRKQTGLVEGYKLKDAEYVFVSMGSIITNAKLVVDQLRKEGDKVGILKIGCFRPFPAKEIKKALSGKQVAVFEKESYRALYSEVKASVPDAKIVSYVGGLGGRDITVNHVRTMFNLEKKKDGDELWVA